MSRLTERAKMIADYENMTLAQLQETLGLTQSHFYNTNRLTVKVIRVMNEKYPEINTDWLQTGKGEMIVPGIPSRMSTSRPVTVPVLPVSAQGGSPNGFEYQVKTRDCEMICSPVENVSIAIPITGDSMSPEYPNGCKVLAQKINEKSFIEWGCTYVLDTVNGAIIKNVYPCKNNEEKIICRSINPNYDDFMVNTSDIRGWYRVRCCIIIR